MRKTLGRPVVLHGGEVERVMARVRAVAGPRARGGTPRRRRASRTMVLGLMVSVAVAGGGSVIGLASARALWRASFPAPLQASATLIGDSIVATLHDTLGLVRFALHVRGASRVVLAGDFNGWSASATPLARKEGTAQWTTVVPLRRGDSRYAFLIDDTRWVAAPRVSGLHARPAFLTARSDRDST
jgi:hypothetical protein